LQIATADKNLRLNYSNKKSETSNFIKTIIKLSIETEWIIPLVYEFLDLSCNESVIELVNKEESETKVRKDLRIGIQQNIFKFQKFEILIHYIYL
jgi:hypothetical protein